MSTEALNTEYNDEMPISEMNRLFIPDKLLILDSLTPFLSKNQPDSLSNLEPLNNKNVVRAKELEKQINDTFDSLDMVRTFHFLEEWSFLVRDENKNLTCPKDEILTRLFKGLNGMTLIANSRGLNNENIKIKNPILGRPKTIKEALYYHETNRFYIADLFNRVYPYPLLELDRL